MHLYLCDTIQVHGEVLQHHRPVLIESQGIWQLKWQISGAAVLDARAFGRGVYGAALPKSPPVPFAQAFGKDSAALSTILKISQVHNYEHSVFYLNLSTSDWGARGMFGVWH